MKQIVRYKVFTAVTMKNAVFWDVAPCRSSVNRRFGGTYRLLFRVEKSRARNQHTAATCSRWFLARDFSTLKMEAIGSSETSGNKIYTAPQLRRLMKQIYSHKITIAIFLY
jgi:hypothetical protein